MTKLALNHVATGLAAIITLSASSAADVTGAQTGVRLEAQRSRPYTLVDGRMVFTGDWVDIGPASPRTGWRIAYDCIELEIIDGAVGELVGGIECNVRGPYFATPSSRWYFGDYYSNPFTSADMTTATAAAGRLCNGLAFGWFWHVAANEPDNDADGRPDAWCMIAIQTFESMNMSCADQSPPEPQDDGSGPLGGVLYDFGFVNRNAGGGLDYYWAFIDSPIGHRMPADGVGGFQMSFVIGFDQWGDPILPTGIDEVLLNGISVQPILWGTGDAEDPPDGRIGYQHPGQYDDNNPSNAVHDYDESSQTAFECYPHAFTTICPTRIGAMAGFYYRDEGGEPCGCSGDLDADGDRDISDLAQLLSVFGQTGAPGTLGCADGDGDGDTDISDLAALLAGFGIPC